jgi:hypothetical protein
MYNGKGSQKAYGKDDGDYWKNNDNDFLSEKSTLWEKLDMYVWWFIEVWVFSQFLFITLIW